MSSSQITLYHYWRSSCSWRVRWALAVKNIPYQSIPVDLLKNEQRQAGYLQINPSGAVPCLIDQGKALSESMAIIEWLEERYPNPALLPSDAWSRAQVREFCGHISSIQSAQNLKVLQRFSQDPGQRSLWAKHFIEDGFEAVEKRLQQTAGTYCFSGQLTAADLFLIPQVYNALRFQVPMQNFPRAYTIYQHCLSLPSCDAAAPHNQPGAQQSP